MQCKFVKLSELNVLGSVPLSGRRNRCIRRAFRCTEPMVSDNQAFSSAVGATSCKTARLFDHAVFRNILDGVDLVRAVANTDGDSDFFEQSKLKVVNGVCLCGFILSMHRSPSDSGARRHRPSRFALLRRRRGLGIASPRATTIGQVDLSESPFC